MGGAFEIANKIRETGTTYWQKEVEAATNESGYTALPAGVRAGGTYRYIGESTYFWSSTMIGYLALSYGLNDLYYDVKLYGYMVPLTFGYSVRLVKD